MSERVFYPDTNDVSSTSKVVALSIARNRTRELILSVSTVQRFHASTNPWHAIALATAARGDSPSCRDHPIFAQHFLWSGNYAVPSHSSCFALTFFVKWNWN